MVFAATRWIVERELGDVGGAGKSLVDRVSIASLQLKADVAGCLRPHFRRVAGEAVEQRHGRQTLVVHREKLGGILGLLQGFGNDQRDAIADMAHEVLRQYRPQRTIVMRARAASLETPGMAGRRFSPATSSPVSTANTPGALRAAVASMLENFRVRVPRPHDIGEGHIRWRDVVDEAALSGQEAPILDTADGCADP